MRAPGSEAHPTVYRDLEELELYALFRGESWRGLDEFHRQQLLQETANRAAVENGEPGGCEVAFAGLPAGTAGEQSGGRISLNREMYVFDRRSVAYNGRTYTVPFPESGLHALNTVLHEELHAFQDRVARGEIPCGMPELAREYAANSFSVVPVPQEDGTVKNGLTYLEGCVGRAGFYLYYLQCTERDAYRFSEEKTLSIVESLMERYGDEPSFAAYRQELEANGYQATLAEARRLLGSDRPEEEISRALMNYYYQESAPVDPRIAGLVSREMTASYEALANRSELAAGPQADSPEAAAEIGGMMPEALGPAEAGMESGWDAGMDGGLE